ncbi:MAG: hypothetical protein IJP86_04250 [Synergistaceae bacterium]|nr:hypothetical protein [Synergistaceae bacterium]
MSEKRECPACHVKLEERSEGYAMGSALTLNRLHADIYTCPECRRIFLYESEGDRMVKCPVCGNMHHAGEKCLFCALNEVQGANAAS